MGLWKGHKLQFCKLSVFIKLVSAHFFISAFHIVSSAIAASHILTFLCTFCLPTPLGFQLSIWWASEKGGVSQYSSAISMIILVSLLGISLLTLLIFHIVSVVYFPICSIFFPYPILAYLFTL